MERFLQPRHRQQKAQQQENATCTALVKTARHDDPTALRQGGDAARASNFQRGFGVLETALCNRDMSL
eukprot:5134828-Amphidinium_carterae.1